MVIYLYNKLNSNSRKEQDNLTVKDTQLYSKDDLMMCGHEPLGQFYKKKEGKKP
jgi:hypothetical protein